MLAAICLLKTSRPTLYRWLRSGRLKGLKVGRQWRFARTDLERFARGEAPRIESHGELDALRAALKVDPSAVRDPVAEVARAILDRALERGASDIHMAPRRDERGGVVAELSHRTTEALEPVASFERRALDALLGHFKVLAHRDLHERNRPQEARLEAWPVPGGTRRVDLNLCFVPPALGESLTPRIQDPRAVRRVFWLDAPSGAVLFLCTGNYFQSRYAEVLLNHRARERGVPARATSRGLAVERGVRNVGPMACSAVERLARRGITAPELDRVPAQVSPEHLAAASTIIAHKEVEHHPLLPERYPAFTARVEYWHVDDVDCCPAEEALARIDALVEALLTSTSTASS